MKPKYAQKLHFSLRYTTSNFVSLSCEHHLKYILLCSYQKNRHSPYHVLEFISGVLELSSVGQRPLALLLEEVVRVLDAHRLPRVQRLLHSGQEAFPDLGPRRRIRKVEEVEQVRIPAEHRMSQHPLKSRLG